MWLRKTPLAVFLCNPINDRISRTARQKILSSLAASIHDCHRERPWPQPCHSANTPNLHPRDKLPITSRSEATNRYSYYTSTGTQIGGSNLLLGQAFCAPSSADPDNQERNHRHNRLNICQYIPSACTHNSS